MYDIFSCFRGCKFNTLFAFDVYLTAFVQGNRIKKTRKINDLGITRVLAYVYI